MLRTIISAIWWLLMLPVRLVMLPFKIVSAIVSIVIYAIVLLILFGVVYFLIL